MPKIYSGKVRASGEIMRARLGTAIKRIALAILGALIAAGAPGPSNAEDILPNTLPLFLAARLNLIPMLPEEYSSDKFVTWTITFWGKFDRNDDGVTPDEVEYLLISEPRQRQQQKYQQMDLNYDGTIDQAEVQESNPLVGDRRRFAEADRNGDGVIDADEVDQDIEAFIDQKGREYSVSEYMQAFVLDPNHDSHVTSPEIATWARELFAFADADHNSVIDREEGYRLLRSLVATELKNCTRTACSWQ
jgi:hypothetical protein